ncbi:MAG: hypothetical protein KGZ58_03795 [Ignavibacteriales bacterium]|nr:hypothetical protein [Ignavibacteriales bacterium]
MKLSKSQFSLLTDAGREPSTVVFGGIVATLVFSKEPHLVSSLFWGMILYAFLLTIALFFKKKGNNDGERSHT